MENEIKNKDKPTSVRLVSKEVLEVTCPKCGYVWTTKSKMKSVSCSNCLAKVRLVK